MNHPALEISLDRIRAAVGSGDRTIADEMAIVALERDVTYPAVLAQVFQALEAEGRAELAPSEAAEVWARYGGLLARSGNLEEAMTALEIALALEPRSFQALNDAGTTRYMQGQLSKAEAYYIRAVELKPDSAEPLAALAAIASRQGRGGDARNLGERALAIDPAAVAAHLAIARADINDGELIRATARLTDLLKQPNLNDQNRIAILDLRAEALDLSDRTAGAFSDYQARNGILARLNAPLVQRDVIERRIDQASRLAAFFANERSEDWRYNGNAALTVSKEAASHVFLVGFPRSGTTLLEKVLASHPGIATLTETNCLAEVGEHFLVSERSLRELSQLTEAAAGQHRQKYWTSAKSALGVNISGSCIVDKMPLNTVALPVVARLFPHAKILFALRDPRDVVFSCFRRRFRVNAAMFEFLTLAGAADYYDRVMTLGAIYRQLLALPILEVRHERMVGNFEAEARAVLNFIGVEWNADVTNFAARAGSGLLTPSDPQLAKGLNAEGIGQWRRYRSQMAPVLAQLNAWASRLGYAAE